MPDEVPDRTPDRTPEEASGQAPDLSSLLQQAQAMQEQLANAQAEAAGQVLVGQSGGGAVKVEVSGTGEFQRVRIDPSAVDPDDVEMLEDLVLAALHEASAKVAELQQGALGTLDLGSLGGLLDR